MRWRQLIAIAFAAAGVACAEGDDSDACALVPVHSAARMRTGTLTGCSFAEEHGGRVVLVVRRLVADDTWASEQAARMSRGPYHEVAGIGDRAFWYRLGNVAVLCVFDRRHYLQVSVFRAGDGTGTAVQLARSTLERLHSQ